MPIARSQLRILAAGECTAVLPLLARVSSLGPRVQLRHFSNPEEILPHLREFAPDLLFVDADCTLFSAPQVCRIFKEHPVTKLWPLFVASCSARACGDVLAAGADDFLTPQIAPQVLLNRLQGLAHLGAARREATAYLETNEPQHERLRQMVNRSLLPQSSDRRQMHISPEIHGRVVILFAGLRGYNRISERLSPGDLVLLLNEYLSLLTDIAHEHGGTIFRMTGESLLVGFGVPQERPDSARLALRTAGEMLVRFGELAALWLEHSHLIAGLGIGLHEGTVAAATVGSPLFMNYTLIGDAVNVAARLCGRARAGEIVLAGALKRSLDAGGLKLRALQLTPISLHGRSEPIDIFCVPLERRLDLSDRLLPPADQKLLREEEVVRLTVLNPAESWSATSTTRACMVEHQVTKS